MPFLNNRILDRAIRGGFTGGLGDFAQSPQTPPFVPDQAPGRLAPMQPPPRPLAKPEIARTPAEVGHQKEFDRLTGVGPDPNQGKSGIQQIKNPVGRTLLTALDAIGSGLFPRIAMNVPGTQAHHNLLLNQEGAALEQEQQNRKDTSTEQLQAEEANRARVQAEVGIPAQAQADIAHAESLTHPKATQMTPHTITTDQGIMQFNPETGRYDINAGKTPDKMPAGSVHQLADGTMFIAHPDGTATPITINGEPAKGPQRSSSEETPDIKNYNQYKKEGGTLSFDAWLTADANRRKPTTIINQGDKLLTPAEAAMLGVPYGTTREAAAGRQPATEEQKKTGNYATRMQQANEVIEKIGRQTAAMMVQGKLPDFANALKSDDTQAFEQAKSNFINAVLRRESGAVINDSEFANGNRQYFPLAGDSEQTLKQKAENRKAVIDNFRQSAGNAYAAPPTLGGASGVTVDGFTFPDQKSADAYKAAKSRKK